VATLATAEDHGVERQVTAMHALVVYESMFGNTQAVAKAIAQGLEGAATVELREVGTSPRVGPEVDLLVVGGPTHAFGLTRASTRASAKEQAKEPIVSTGIGVREWLDDLPSTDHPVRMAAFDTRVRPARVPGSAAKGIAKRLRAKGFRSAKDPATFWVRGTPGPLDEGELDRARAWGAAIRDL
jgi:hypothetical protein